MTPNSASSTFSAPRSAAPPTRGQLRRAGDNGACALGRGLADALRSGEAAAAEAVIDEALKLGLAPDAVQSLVIAPAMARVGELWEMGQVTVADEHHATAMCEGLLHRLRESENAAWATSPASGATVLLAAVEGQRHVVGLRMVADVLEEAGFEVIYLGADVPVGALRSSVARYRPAVIGLSFGFAVDVGLLAESLWAVHEVSPDTRVMLGGRSVPPALWAAGYPRAKNTTEVLAIVEELLAGPPQAAPAVLGQLRVLPPAAEAVEAPPTPAVALGLARADVATADPAREELRGALARHALDYRDPLSGLMNSRGFEEEIATAHSGTGSTWTLVVLDVDDMAARNDEHGTHEGDRLLRTIGQIAGGARRPGDVAARTGGDEFSLLLRDATVAEGERIAERLRAEVERGVPGITVSLAVVALSRIPRASRFAADGALLEAKLSGGNRVVASGSPRVPAVAAA